MLFPITRWAYDNFRLAISLPQQQYGAQREKGLNISNAEKCSNNNFAIIAW